MPEFAVSLFSPLIFLADTSSLASSSSAASITQLVWWSISQMQGHVVLKISFTSNMDHADLPNVDGCQYGGYKNKHGAQATKPASQAPAEVSFYHYICQPQHAVSSCAAGLVKLSLPGYSSQLLRIPAKINTTNTVCATFDGCCSLIWQCVKWDHPSVKPRGPKRSTSGQGA